MKRRRFAVDIVHKYGEMVGQYDLLKQPKGHNLYAVCKSAERDASVFIELWQKLRRFHNRPRYQLREKADVKRQLDEIVFNRNLFPMYVDHIAQRLKRVEGNTHRQDNLQRAEVSPDDCRGGAEEEVKVLEEPEHDQRDN